MPPRRPSKEIGAISSMRDATSSRDTSLSLGEMKGRNSRWTTDTADFAESKDVVSPSFSQWRDESTPSQVAAATDQSGTVASVGLDANPQQKHPNNKKKQTPGGVLGVELL
jgi:hypothetical protein